MPFCPEELIEGLKNVSARQSEILIILAQHIDQIVESNTILQSVRGNDSYSNPLALNVQITYLRKMLEADTASWTSPKYIEWLALAVDVLEVLWCQKGFEPIIANSIRINRRRNEL